MKYVTREESGEMASPFDDPLHTIGIVIIIIIINESLIYIVDNNRSLASRDSRISSDSYEIGTQ